MMREDLITLDDITHWAPAGSCTSLHMLRLDKIHPVVSGNKWYKLKLNIAVAKSARKTTLLTFGGGYSNHLVATAAAAQEAGLGAIGIVRGVYEKRTATLEQCAHFGMELRFLMKAQYDVARSDIHFANRFPDAHIIPEGGANEPGIFGTQAIGGLIPDFATTVILPVGTGTTIAGLHHVLSQDKRLIGCCAAKACDDAMKLLSQTDTHNTSRLLMLPATTAFGKISAELKSFIRSFFLVTGIPLDVVYTGKMMMQVAHLLEAGNLACERIMCIHTGGLQGNPADLFENTDGTGT